MKKMKQIIALLFAFTLVLVTFAGCGKKTEDEKNNSDKVTEGATAGNARTLNQIKDSGKVIIGVFSDKKPFGYVDENGAYQGYDVYFGNRIAADLGVTVEYVSVEPASRVEYLETGKVDIILANFTVTAERAEKVDFALPYMKVALGVVSKDNAVFRSVEDLNGKTLIVAKGTTAETYFTENHPEVNLLKFDEYSETYNALLDGRGDAFSTDNTEVLAWAIENPGFTVGIESLGSLDTIAPAVQKGNKELLQWLNEEIVTLGKENFFHANYAATLADVYGDAVDPDNLVVEGGVITESETGSSDTATTPVESKGTIKIAASATPHADILEVAKPLLKDLGYDLEITIFDDYIQPNLVVDGGDFDANYFQHIPYLDSFNIEQGTKLVNASGIHYEPFGIYPGTKSSLTDLAKGDVIAVPNDTTNEARALLLLQSNGIITLKEGAGLKATIFDIVDNPYDVEILELEAAQVPRVKDEAAFIVLNGNYALEAGFSVSKDAIAYEKSDSEAAKTYVNVIAVGEGNENSDAIRALVEVLTSETIVNYINDTYDGAVIPFK